MELIFVMFVVVVIIVIYLDNVVTIGIMQDGNDPCVLVVLVMTNSSQAQRDGFIKDIVVIVRCRQHLEFQQDLLVYRLNLLDLIVSTTAPTLVVAVIAYGLVVVVSHSMMMIFVDMVLGEQVEWLR